MKETPAEIGIMRSLEELRLNGIVKRVLVPSLSHEDDNDIHVNDG